MGVNSSSTLQVCSSIDIEEHRGPCKCKCLIKSCHYNKEFNRDSCQCMCKDTFAVLKRDCLLNGGGRATNFWDEETCSCKCRPRRCVKGHYQGIFNYGCNNNTFYCPLILNYPHFFILTLMIFLDQTTCECKPIVSTCSAMGTTGVIMGENG